MKARVDDSRAGVDETRVRSDAYERAGEDTRRRRRWRVEERDDDCFSRYHTPPTMSMPCLYSAARTRLMREPDGDDERARVYAIG